MITFRSATPRPTAWVIFRRKFTAVHHYLLHSPSSTPFASMFTKETKRASRRQVRKERKKERGGTRFVPSSLSLSLSIYSPLFLRFTSLVSSVSLPCSRKNVVSSRTSCRVAFHTTDPLRRIDVAKANGERGGGWLVVGVGCRGSSSTSTLSLSSLSLSV